MLSNLSGLSPVFSNNNILHARVCAGEVASPTVLVCAGEVASPTVLVCAGEVASPTVLVCAGDVASPTVLVFIPYVSQLFVSLLKAKLLTKLLGVFFIVTTKIFVSWGMTAGICVLTIQNKQLLPLFYDVPPNCGVSVRHHNQKSTI
jgi:hypothetical protein